MQSNKIHTKNFPLELKLQNRRSFQTDTELFLMLITNNSIDGKNHFLYLTLIGIEFKRG